VNEIQVWSIGGMLLTGEDQSTWRSASPFVTISTTNSTCNDISS